MGQVFTSSADLNSAALIERDERISFAQLRVLVDHAKARLDCEKNRLLTANPCVAFVAQLLAHLESGIPAVVVSPSLSSGELATVQDLISSPVDQQCALILFTSGSGGRARAVQLSMENIEANTEAVIESLDFATASGQTLFLPLSHSFGLLGQLLPALRLGIPTKLATFFSLQSDILEGRASGMWSGVPSHWETLLRVTQPQQCRAVTHVISAGAPLSLSLRRRLVSHFANATIYNNYGLTEASPRVASLRSTHPGFWTEHTVGLPVKNIALRVGEGNELLVSGKQVMLGYLGDVTDRDDKIKNGWLRTGDIASFGTDGLVQVTGRADELVKVGGERVNLLEIESALLKLSEITNAALLSENEDLHGVRLSAFLIAARKLDRPSLLRELRAYLSGSKLPADFFQIDELPLGEGGKIRRSALKHLKSVARRIV